MKVKDFVEQFSHNNAICVYNKNGYLMKCIINDKKEEWAVMDWYLPKSELAEVEFIKIMCIDFSANVSKLAFIVDTNQLTFKMIPELCDTPLWLYNDTHPENQLEASVMN